MAAIFQTTFSNALSWMKKYKFRLRFHWTLFPRVQLTMLQHWFIWWLSAVQATSYYLNQSWLFYWRIYASLGLNELTHWGRVTHICVSKITIAGPVHRRIYAEQGRDEWTVLDRSTSCMPRVLQMCLSIQPASQFHYYGLNRFLINTKPRMLR